MVQQIASQLASNKPESAAKTLPFDFNAFSGTSLTQQTFNNELFRQSQLLQVYEQPRQPVDNTQAYKPIHQHSDNNNSQQQINGRERRQQQNRDMQSNRDDARSGRQQQTHNKNDSRDTTSAYEKAKHADDNKRDSDVDSTIDKKKAEDTKQIDTTRASQQNSQSNIEKSINDAIVDKTSKSSEPDLGELSADDANLQSNELALNNTNKASGKDNQQNNADSEKDLKDIQQANAIADNLKDTMATKESLAQNTQDTFDYIAHVSQIAGLSSKPPLEEQIKADMDSPILSEEQRKLLSDTAAVNEQTSHSEFIQTHASLVQSDLKAATPENSDDEIVIEINTDSSEVSKVSLTKEELQSILDARHTNLDLNAELSASELEKLSVIVSDMLKQLSEVEKDSLSTQESDQRLLQSLLIDAENSKEFSELMLASAEQKTTESEFLAEKELSLEASVLAANKATDAIMGDKEARNQQTILEEQKLSQIALQNAGQTDLSAKTSTSGNSNSQDSASKQAALALASLNEQQTQEALNNLKQRVQSIVSEAGEPVKGNEFILALQSSVQEFKQQIKAGHEPAIDIKSMVSDALAQSNIDTSSVKQPKIDASLGQFNAILNLANSVNYSANQQQAQVLGITDMQLAKEINHQQIEGTKLANANNQLSAQANADKAVNIFKQEGQAQLAEKVRWMVNSRNTSAEIRLDPPDLGGMNIKVNLSGDTAQVNFNVQSSAAKEALDQAVPRLRDMLGEQGIELGESYVQQEHQGDSQRGQTDSEDRFGAGSHGQSTAASSEELQTDGAATVLESSIQNGALGGIDYYA